jgi:hypothetical protein
MNDDQVLTAARNALADVRLSTPLDETMRRGRALRTRRRRAIAGTAALASLSAVAAAIASTVPQAGGSGSGITLQAWTVTAGPGDSVNVTVRQTYDAAGLQRTLRADGIPVRVVFAGDGIPEMNPALPPQCHAAAMSDKSNADAQARILGTPASLKSGLTVGSQIPGRVAATSKGDHVLHPIAVAQSAMPVDIAFTIHKRQIPQGVGLFIAVNNDGQTAGSGAQTWGWGLDLVQATAACTG